MTMDGMGYDLAIKYAPSGGPDVFESGGKEEFPKKTRRFRIPLKKNTKMPHTQKHPWDERYLCLHLLVMFMVKLVGKYTSFMDPVGYATSSHRKPSKLRSLLMSFSHLVPVLSVGSEYPNEFRAQKPSPETNNGTPKDRPKLKPQRKGVNVLKHEASIFRGTVNLTNSLVLMRVLGLTGNINPI